MVMSDPVKRRKLQTFVGSLHAFLPDASDFRRAFRTEPGEVVSFPLPSAGCVAVREDVAEPRWQLYDERSEAVGTLLPPEGAGGPWRIEFEP